MPAQSDDADADVDDESSVAEPTSSGTPTFGARDVWDMLFCTPYDDPYMGVSQNSVHQKSAERYRPPPSILVVFHAFFCVTPMTHTF